jgi:hypothetical protein
VNLRYLLAVWLLISAAACADAAAQCPSAQNPREPYALGVGEESVSEIYRLDTGETRVVSRYKGSTVVEQTLFQGLIRIEHIDRGRRTVYTPRDNLSKLFPLIHENIDHEGSPPARCDVPARDRSLGRSLSIARWN